MQVMQVHFISGGQASTLSDYRSHQGLQVAVDERKFALVSSATCGIDLDVQV
jgi:hypothetical protein